MIGTPGGLFNRPIDLAQAAGGHSQGNDLADAHHDVPGNYLNALRWKLLKIILAAQLGIDLIERFRLVVP